MNLTQDPLYVEDEIPLRDDIARREQVRSITGETTVLMGNATAAGGFKSFVLEYDRSGRRIRQEHFDSAGRLVRQALYDGDGRLVQDTIYNAAGNADYRFEILYHGDDWTEKRMYSPPDRLHYRISAERDASGNLLRAVYLNAGNQTIRVDSYSYDAHGRIVHTELGNLGESTYEYDERNNLVRKSRVMPGASVLGEVFEFEYDDRDLIVCMRQEHISHTRFTVDSF